MQSHVERFKAVFIEFSKTIIVHEVYKQTKSLLLRHLKPSCRHITLVDRDLAYVYFAFV